MAAKICSVGPNAFEVGTTPCGKPAKWVHRWTPGVDNDATNGYYCDDHKDDDCVPLPLTVAPGRLAL